MAALRLVQSGTRRPASPRRRGSVIIIVLWTIAVTAILAAATQLMAYRQAMIGRVSVERIQARWAARGGIESTLQVMANHTEFPFEGDAKAMIRDMEYVHYEQFAAAEYDIGHSFEGREWEGPMDEHRKINVNGTNTSQLMALEDMTADVIDALMDWLDDNDDPGVMGVERDYYLSLATPYEPRNGPIRSIAELELVAGIWPEYLRGEDWNLNGRLDPNENDGERTLPYDQSDGELDPGWSEFLTAYTVDGGATMSGQERIYLRRAEPEELVDRVGVSDAQARSLIYYGRNERNTLEKLATTPLRNVDDQGNAGNTVVNPAAEPLEEEQIRRLLEEVTITDPLDRPPGKLNINTISPRLLRNMLEVLGAEAWVADELLYLRDSRPEGIASVMDLQEIPDVDANLWNTLITLFTTHSNVYTITARGRSLGSGLEVEIIAIVDRSTLPVKILEYREQ